MQNINSDLPTWYKSIVKRNPNGGWQIIAANESGKEIMAIAPYFDSRQEAVEMSDEFFHWKMCASVSIES
jgi:hypothetical protein